MRQDTQAEDHVKFINETTLDEVVVDVPRALKVFLGCLPLGQL